MSVSLMRQEIEQQPDAVRHAIESTRAGVDRLVSEAAKRNVRSVIIAARGTSDNAGVYAKYLLEIAAQIPVSLAAPSVYTLYGAAPKLDHALVLGISQSGQGADVIQVLDSARKSGALTASITNNEYAPIAAVSDHLLLCDAGEERSVAATKTYTTALAIVALLAVRWSKRSDLEAELESIPDKMRKTLAVDSVVGEFVERYRYMNECAVLARGVNQATALEAALKMTETSYIAAKPYSGADFLHGPVALVESGFPCFLYAPPGKTLPFMRDMARQVTDRGGEIVVATSDADLLATAHKRIPMPVDTDELLSPLLYILPAQLLAHDLAVTKGNNPDRPRGLKKVTSTR